MYSSRVVNQWSTYLMDEDVTRQSASEFKYEVYERRIS